VIEPLTVVVVLPTEVAAEVVAVGDEASAVCARLISSASVFDELAVFQAEKVE
jgi:hypothetical protein